MIRRVVDFALNNRLMVLGMALVLFVWGIISFNKLPIEAYPDVADNYVEIITQWPGISAEQIEQQVTIPLETSMNGIPGIVHLRSFSLFGLSDVKLIFEDGTDNAWNRERVLERLEQVTLPTGVSPQMGTDWSPVGQIYFFTLHSSNPQYDAMELKSLEDWVVEKNLKSVPDIVDVASFGGPTREYQVRLDPNKLISYGLSLSQVEQQLVNNNTNAGGSFIQAGLQQINVREVGLVDHVHDIEQTVVLTKNGTPVRIQRHCRSFARPENQARPVRPRHSPRERQNRRQRRRRLGHRALAQGRQRRPRSQGSPRKDRRDERSPPAPRSKDRPFNRSQHAGSLHHAHRASQPDRRHGPGLANPASVSGQCPGRDHRRLNHSVCICCLPPLAST